MRLRPTSRRDLIKIGLLGSTGLNLSHHLRTQAARRNRLTGPSDTSIIWLWLQGGAPHIETFDPKMEAPSDYRSMVGALSTSLPGVEFGGQLPMLATHAHEMSIVRSFHHSNADHLGASHHVLTARDAPGGVQQQQSPSLGSVAARVRGASHPQSGVPTFVRLSRTISFDFDQPMWLGVANSPFDADGPSRSNLNISIDASRLDDRQSLLQGLDRMQREADQSGLMAGMDSFEQQALDLVSGGFRQAFDVSKENPKLRERYGPKLGAQLLTARRLCEAGCGFVTLNYGWAPTPSDTPFAWDMHLGPGQPKAPPMKQQLESIFS